MKPCPNGTYSATALTPNQPGLAASIPSSLVNLVLNDFETFTSTVDDIIEADDTWQYIQDNILDILKEPAQRNLYSDADLTKIILFHGFSSFVGNKLQITAHYYLHLVKCGDNLSFSGNGFITHAQSDLSGHQKIRG